MTCTLRLTWRGLRFAGAHSLPQTTDSQSLRVEPRHWHFKGHQRILMCSQSGETLIVRVGGRAIKNQEMPRGTWGTLIKPEACDLAAASDTE